MLLGSEAGQRAASSWGCELCVLSSVLLSWEGPGIELGMQLLPVRRGKWFWLT